MQYQARWADKFATLASCSFITWVRHCHGPQTDRMSVRMTNGLVLMLWDLRSWAKLEELSQFAVSLNRQWQWCVVDVTEDVVVSDISHSEGDGRRHQARYRRAKFTVTERPLSRLWETTERLIWQFIVPMNRGPKIRDWKSHGMPDALVLQKYR